MILSFYIKQFIKSSNLLPILYISLANYNTSPTLEHVLPRSCISKHVHTKDIHNIFATTYNMNSIRSNYIFGYLNKYDSDVINYNENLISINRKIFYPITNSRGPISRALLYMKNEYNYTQNLGNYTEYNEWNKIYKPTSKEIIHNEYAFLLQGKRRRSQGCLLPPLYIDNHIKNDKKLNEILKMLRKDILDYINNQSGSLSNLKEWDNCISNMYKTNGAEIEKEEDSSESSTQMTYMIFRSKMLQEMKTSMPEKSYKEKLLIISDKWKEYKAK